MYNHNKAQLSKNHMNISWDILYMRQRRLMLLTKACMSDCVESICDLAVDRTQSRLFSLEHEVTDACN